MAGDRSDGRKGNRCDFLWWRERRGGRKGALFREKKNRSYRKRIIE